MNNLIDLYRSEPAVVINSIAALITAILEAVIAFGVPVSGAQQDSIKLLVQLGLPPLLFLISGLLTRSQVSPVAKPIVVTGSASVTGPQPPQG